jgi:clan AA aspartic protease
VTPDREPTISVRVTGLDGQHQEIRALIDTGFDGFLTLPSGLIATLNLPWRRRGRAILADGAESVFDIHEGIVDWDGRQRRVPVDAVELMPLIGMRLLDGYELTIQAVAGGSVVIHALPSRDSP